MRKEEEEIRVTVSKFGGDIRDIQRVRKMNKIGSRESEELGIATGGSQIPEKHEAPRNQWDWLQS